MAGTDSTTRPHRKRNPNSTSKTHRGRRRPRFQSRRAPPPLDHDTIRSSLKAHANTLREAMAVATTCCDALRWHSFTTETEVAMVLRIHCGNKLHRALQEVGVLLVSLDGIPDADPESDEVMAAVDPSPQAE